MTWLARRPLPVSMPFISDTTTVSDPMCGAQAARLVRRDWAGIDSTRKSTPPSAVAGSVVAVTE
ncbi:hypothetical protein SLAVM298S_01478 [Streptomyces lavendulae subsp. lavendulae]